MDQIDLQKWCKSHSFPCIKPKIIAAAYLKGYKLVFNYFSSSRNSGAANIMQFKGDVVYGLIMELNDVELDIIRKKEGYPNYYGEVNVSVITNENKEFVNVKTYKVVAQKELQSHQPPSKYYLNLIIRNAEKYGFPTDYINLLLIDLTHQYVYHLSSWPRSVASITIKT